MKTLLMSLDELLMNQMYLMNLLEGLWSKKIFFCLAGCLLAGIWCMQVHRASILAVFGLFPFILFILVAFWMKQMYIDEPLCIFKRFFAFGNLPDEPWGRVVLHRSTFGSLRNEGWV